MTALEMNAQGALWFFTDVQSSKVDYLRAVNLSFTDRDQGVYVSLSGRDEIIQTVRASKACGPCWLRPGFPKA